MLLKVYKSKVWMLLFMLMPFLGNAQVPGLPPGWDFTLNPTSATYAIPADVPFNGVDALSPGDWIGVFYNDDGTMECGGAVQWDGTNNVAIVAFGNDTLVAPDKNGFSEGEEVMWKFYYEATMTETEVCTTPTFSWTNGDLAEVEEFKSCQTCQEINLSVGTQFISSYVEPLDLDFKNVMTDILDNLNIAKNSAGSTLRKIGPVWVNSIGNWVTTEGYIMTMTGADLLTICGDIVPYDTPIPVSGTKLVSYLHQESMNAQTAFGSILDNLNIAKNSAGATLRKIGPVWVNGIGNLNPGEGYLITMNASDEIVYPAMDNVSGNASTTVKHMKSVHFEWPGGNAAEYTWSIYVDLAMFEGVTLEAGDEIAVMDGDKIVGVRTLTGPPTPGTFSEELVAFNVLGDLTPGYAPGNPVSFVAWDASEDIESVAFTANYLNPYGDAYTENVFPAENNEYSIVEFDFAGPDQNCPTLISAVPGEGSVMLTWEGVIPDMHQVKKNRSHFEWPGGNAAEYTWSIYVDLALFSGLTLEAGDEIAVMDGDKIVGVRTLTGPPTPGTFSEELVAFNVLGDLTPGYTPGNPVSFVAYDVSEDIESESFTAVYLNPYGDAYTENVFPVNNNEYSIVEFEFGGGYTPSFNVYYNSGELIEAGVTGNTYEVIGLENGVEYCFYVTQNLEGGIESCQSNILCATPIGCEDATISNFPEFQEDVCLGTELVIDFSGVEILNAETIEWLVDPAVAGEYVGTDFVLNTTYVGPVTLTLNAYAFEPCMDATASLTFNVNPLPEVICPEDFAVCEDAGVIVLADLGAEPAGGTFYDLGGNMMTEFDPAFGAGDYTFIYEYTDENGCTNSCQFVITVNALPEVTIEAYEPVCIGSEMFELYGGMPDGGTYYVDGEEATMFDPMNAGTYEIEYCYTDENGCFACAMTTLIVNDLPEVFCPEDIETCVTTPAFMLTDATPEGGVYSGMGVADNMFDPAVAGVGVYEITYTYTDANGCSNECAFMITVLPAPEVFAGMDATIAEDDSYTLADATAANVDDINWTTSGDGMFDDVALLNATYTPGPDDIAAGSVTLSIIGVGFCGTAEDSMELTIVGGGCINPPTAFAGDDAAICEGDDFMLMDATATDYASLMWTSSGDGMFDDPMAMNPTYMPGVDDILNGMVELCLTAEPSDPNCQAVTDCMMLTINMLPIVECPEDFAVCIDEEPWMLYGATPEGGVYAGEGVVDGMFDPALAGVGTWEITYTYEDLNGCMNYCMFNITVNPLPDVMLEAFEPVCAGILPFELTGGMPAGGVYYVDGIETTIFDPAVAGTYMVEYVYTDENGCTNSAMGELVVNPTPDVTLVAYEPACEGSEPFALYGGLPEGGIYYVDGVPATMFDPAVAGTYMIGYEFTNEFGCTGFVENEFVVNPTPVAICEDIEVCENGDVIEFMPGEYDQYIYDGVVITSFDPAMYGPGVYEITFIAGNEFGCFDECMFTITVIPIPAIIQQPVAVEVIYGDNAEFMVVAEYADGYQWYGPDGMIVGANAATLIIEGVLPEDAGEYYVEVFNDCGSVMSEMALLTVLPWTQVIDFGGMANGMSTYLELINPDIAFNMEPIEDILQSVEFMRPNKVYVPGGPSFDWNEEKGAKVLLEEGWPASIEVVGYPVLGPTLDLPGGWSLMPVWSYGVIEASDIFDQLGGDLIAAFSIDYSGMYWPAYGIYTLEYLVPGNAYLVALAGPQTINFDVPIVDATPGYAMLPPNITSWNDVSMTGVQHNIAITSDALADLQVGDVIGAFNQNGAIAGMVEVTSTRDNIALRVYGDNAATQKADGFIEGDVLTFRVYRNGVEFEVFPTFDQEMPNTNVFAENGLSAITDLKDGTTSISDPDASLTASLYPNPATDMVNIAANFQIRNLKVVNYVGQVVYDRNVDQMEIQVNTSNFGPGMYFVQIESVDGIVITKRLSVN